MSERGGGRWFKRVVAEYAPLVAIAGGLLVSVPRLAAAFAAVEPPFAGLPTSWVTGPGYGLVMAAAVLYVWHVYQERKRLKLAWMLLVGWIILLILMAVILVPGMLAQIRGMSLAELLAPPVDAFWCGFIAVSNELAIALAALAVAMSKDRAGTQRAESAKPATRKQRTNGHGSFECPWCERSFGSQNALNAHSGKCAERKREKEIVTK